MPRRSSSRSWNVVSGLAALLAGCGQAGGGLGEACRGGDDACDAGLYCLEEVCQGGELVAARAGLAAPEIDLLFVVDNSASMVGEQIQLAQSFSALSAVLDERFGQGRYRVGVVTTGMESQGCPRCDGMIYSCCMNETGESGRLQDRVGSILSLEDPEEFSFEQDPTCRVVASSNLECIFDPQGGGLYGSGTVFVGTNGCGYEKGLEPVRLALSAPLARTVNAGFLREDAVLAVVVVSDEEDCGRVGDISENLSGIGGKACYYAARGEAPDGATSDPLGLALALTPVAETYDFLMGLKGNRPGMVKFAAVVGLEDPANPAGTEIRYESSLATAGVLPACTTPGCQGGEECKAFPGTRYVELAEMFGLGVDGYADTICQADFSQTLALLGRLVACPREVWLAAEPGAPEALRVAVNERSLPRHSCAGSGELRACTPGGTECGGEACVESWSYRAPEGATLAMNRGGEVTLAAHVDPCASVSAGAVKLEVFLPSSRGSP